MAELVERARSTFLGAGGRHGVLVDLPADLPPVMADRRRIVQVLNNLLANAGRHAPESSPIRVAAARDGSHVAVSVADEGDGMAPEVLPNLFRRHAGAGEGGAAAGYGLGLGRPITVHGFRSTFRVWAMEQVPGSSEAAEVALAHEESDRTKRAYARSALDEPRAKLMQQWADYVLPPSDGSGDG